MPKVLTDGEFGRYLRHKLKIKMQNCGGQHQNVQNSNPKYQ
jgi:hypothetical protein